MLSTRARRHSQATGRNNELRNGPLEFRADLGGTDGDVLGSRDPDFYPPSLDFGDDDSTSPAMSLCPNLSHRPLFQLGVLSIFRVPVWKTDRLGTCPTDRGAGFQP